MSWSTKVAGALLFAWLAAPLTVAAQLAGPQAGVAAGATLPSGDLSLAGFKIGWQGMAFVAFPIRHSPVAFRLDASYGANTSSDPINGDPTESRVTLLGGDADLTLTLPSPLGGKGYLLGGPGLYRVSYTQTRQSQGTSSFEETKFAYNLGVGLTVGAVFFEVRYVHVDGFGNSFSRELVPITAGFRFGVL